MRSIMEHQETTWWGGRSVAPVCSMGVAWKAGGRDCWVISKSGGGGLYQRGPREADDGAVSGGGI
jgi:hypothetical protein